MSNMQYVENDFDSEKNKERYNSKWFDVNLSTNESTKQYQDLIAERERSYLNITKGTAGKDL